jgi:hypothetical protein
LTFLYSHGAFQGYRIDQKELINYKRISSTPAGLTAGAPKQPEHRPRVDVRVFAGIRRMWARARAQQPERMADKSAQRWRQAAVWLHIITSVGWMSQALALVALMTVSFTSGDVSVRVSATSMAHVLDTSLLAPLANAAAFTGFMLAASTPWGYFRHWWVLVKFAITIVQLYAGIFILSDALQDSVMAARAGEPTPPLPQIVGAGLMAGAIAFQAWLSVVKPWQRTPWTAGGGKRAPKLPTAPRWVFVATVCAPLVDIAVGLYLGNPMPALSLLVLVIRLVGRRRQLRQAPSAHQGNERANFRQSQA